MERLVVCEPCPHGDTLRGCMVRATVAREDWTGAAFREHMRGWLAARYEADFVPAPEYMLHVGEPVNFGTDVPLTLTAL